MAVPKVMTINPHQGPHFIVTVIYRSRTFDLFNFIICVVHNRWIMCAARAEKDHAEGTPSGMVLARWVLRTDNGRYTKAWARNTAGIARENDLLGSDVGSSLSRWATYCRYLSCFLSHFFVLFLCIRQQLAVEGILFLGCSCDLWCQ